MRHDPLCIIASLDPTSYDYEERAYYECQCHLVARVREDERTRVVCEFMSNHGDREMYAAALRDAVEAVKALEPRLELPPRLDGYDCCGCSTPQELFDDAIAAIEALGDTPRQQANEHINPTGYDPAATDNRP